MSIKTKDETRQLSDQQAEFDAFIQDEKHLDNGHRKQQVRSTHSTDKDHPAQNQVSDNRCKNSLVDNDGMSDQVRPMVILPDMTPQHKKSARDEDAFASDFPPLLTPERVLIGTSTAPTANPNNIQDSETNQPQAWPCTRTQAYIESNPAHTPRPRKLTGDATWPPGRPPSSGPGGPQLGGPERTILRVETDQGAATLAALEAWRKPIAPVSEQELEDAFAALRQIGRSRPSSTQVPPDSHPHRVEPPPHIPASINIAAFRDPEADVRALPDDLTLFTPRTGVRYYTNTEANRRGALLELPRPRLVPDTTDDGERTTCTGTISNSGGPPGARALPLEGAAPALMRIASSSGGGREDLRRGYVQEAVTPTDVKRLDLVLDGRLTPDDPPTWVDTMIKRILTQVGPLELRMQVTRRDSYDSAGWRAAGAQAKGDYLGDLTMREDAGMASSKLNLTLSRSGVLQLRQDEVDDRAGRCCTARGGGSRDGSSASAWALGEVASASTASSTRGLSGSAERITMLDGGERGLHSSPSPGCILAVGLRSEVSCGGSPPAGLMGVPSCGARSSTGADTADTGTQLRNQEEVARPPSGRGSASDSRPLTCLAGFEWPRRGQRASTRGKRWTARVGVTLDGEGSLTARLLEDVASTAREGGHVWNIALERIVEGTDQGEDALEAEDTKLCCILEGPVIGEQLDAIRDTAFVTDLGSMQTVLSRVLRLLGGVSGKGGKQKGPEDPRILQDVPPVARSRGGGDGRRA